MKSSLKVFETILVVRENVVINRFRDSGLLKMVSKTLDMEKVNERKFVKALERKSFCGSTRWLRLFTKQNI